MRESPPPLFGVRAVLRQKPQTNTSPVGFGIVFIVVLAVCLFILFRPFFKSHFDATLSDLSDGRFELTILEHWTKVFHGQGHIASPNFFYPVQGVLGYSDAFFGLAIPHAVLRSLGADRYLAVQLSTMFFAALGFAAMYFLLRGPGHFARSTALLGAALFLISNMYYIHVVRPYILVSVMLAPAVFLVGARYWRDKDTYPTKARVWLCLCALLLVFILYTSCYIGWFLILCSAVLWVVYLAFCWLADRGQRPLRQALRAADAQKWNLILGAAVLVVALIPFLLLYLPSLQHNGKRSVADSLPYLQPPLGVLDVGRDSMVWGALSAKIQHFNSPGGILEHPTGWPLVTVCLFLSTATYCFVRLHRLAKNSDATDGGKLYLMAAIAFTCFAMWPVGIRIGQHAPAWAVLLKLVPGAGGIRVPQRIHLVLNIGVVMVCMFGFERLRDTLSKRGAFGQIVLVLLGCFLLVEQVNFMPTHAISRADEAQKFARVPAPPPDCSAFYVSSWSDNPSGRNIYQTDGMMIAQMYGIPTLNGTSSWFPVGWNLLGAPKGHVNEEAMSWAITHGLTQGLCALEMNSGQWTKKDVSHFNPTANLDQTVDGKLADPGFEDDDLAYWAPFQAVHGSASTANPHSGIRSLAETEGAGSMYQDAKGLEPNHKYRVTAWASSSPGATAGAQVAAWNADTSVAALSKVVYPQGTWQFLSTVASADKSGSLRIHLFRMEGSGTIYWDDVRIYLDGDTHNGDPQN